MPVEGLDDVKVVRVACSDSLTVALTDLGHVYTWGTFRVCNVFFFTCFIQSYC